MFVRVFYSKTHHFLVPMTNSFTQKESGNDKKSPASTTITCGAFDV